MSFPLPVPVERHRGQAPAEIRCAVITVSDSRTTETDLGGALVVELLAQAGHKVVLRRIVPDDPELLRPLLVELLDGKPAGSEYPASQNGLRESTECDVVLLTGGTGIAQRDRTYETVAPLLDKLLPGYGELLRMLSYAEIGSAAMLSRAVGGVCGRKVLLTMPGSPAGVRLAMTKVILPELGHLVSQAGS